jgi:hypothetical protein
MLGGPEHLISGGVPVVHWKNLQTILMLKISGHSWHVDL